VVFRPLSRESIRLICSIQVKRLARRLESRGIHLEMSDAALDKVGDAGFDPVYGARPLKRAIQEHLENPLAQEILRGEYEEGSLVYVDVEGEELTFAKRIPEEQVA